MSSTLIKLISSLEIKTDRHSMRTFGFGLAIILAGFALLGLWLKGDLNLWLIVAGAVSGLLTFISYRLLFPIYYPWMVITKLLGMLITYTLLTFAFYVILTPLGMLMRMKKGDPLKRTWSDFSYWEARENEPDKRMNRMF